MQWSRRVKRICASQNKKNKQNKQRMIAQASQSIFLMLQFLLIKMRLS